MATPQRDVVRQHSSRSAARMTPMRAPAARPATALAGLQQLQRGAGNVAMARMLRASHIQAKLTVGPVDDVYEREADAVARQVMRMPDSHDPAVQRAPLSIQRLCPGCEEDEKVQRAPGGSSSGAPAELEPYLSSQRGGGQRLPDSTRAFFEPRFGHDFGSVRVHADSRATQAANSVQARAFTVGRDIVFGANQSQPGTQAGRTLLAHELTHVVQQGSAGGQLQRASVSVSGGSASSTSEPSAVSGSSGASASSGSSASASSGGGGCDDPYVPPVNGFRVCSRALGGVLGTGGLLNHAYIEAPPDNRYAIITRCKPTSGSDWVVTGTAAAKTDRSPDPCCREPNCVTCTPKPGVSNLAACLRAAFGAYSNPSLYRGLGPNSNTFAGTLARACCDQMVPKPRALGVVPGWDDSPAPGRAATCPPPPPHC
jgi:hypothetical protein